MIEVTKTDRKRVEGIVHVPIAQDGVEVSGNGQHCDNVKYIVSATQRGKTDAICWYSFCQFRVITDVYDAVEIIRLVRDPQLVIEVR